MGILDNRNLYQNMWWRNSHQNQEENRRRIKRRNVYRTINYEWILQHKWMSRSLELFNIPISLKLKFWDTLNCLYFCKVNCQWGAWATQTCTKTCGGGSHTKHRTKTVVEANGGTCTGPSTVNETCNTNKCPGH